MGIHTYLVTKLGEDKASKLKAIFGAFFIYILGSFPIATIVIGLDWNPIYAGYALLVWSALVIALTSIIILFFGKSELFPYPAKGEEKPEEVPEAEEEVIATDNASVDEPPAE